MAGNVSLEKTYLNAIKILSLVNRIDIPIYKGMSKPLKQKHITLEDVFGETGMAGTENWPVLPIEQKKENAVDFLKTTYNSLSKVNVIRSIDKKEFVELMYHLLNNLN